MELHYELYTVLNSTLLNVTMTVGSPAARAGVFLGDKVIAIDNQDVVHASVETVRQLIPSSEWNTYTHTYILFCSNKTKSIAEEHTWANWTARSSSSSSSSSS